MAVSGSGLRSTAGSFLRSPRVRAVWSFPFRLGPADSDWKRQPFAGLAAVNNLSGAGDALVTVALAGSVFVSVSLNAARGRTALGLVCTVLPFAVVGPFVGPAIDRMRGGRRLIIFLAAVGRVAACLLMASWIHSLLLFPAAFASLVCSKTHAVAKASLVPGVVDREDHLVRANSRLAVGGAFITSLAAGIGSGIYKLFGSRALLDLDVLVFAACAGLSLYLLRNTLELAGGGPGEVSGSVGVGPVGVGPVVGGVGSSAVDGRLGRGRGHIGGRPVGGRGGLWGRPGRPRRSGGARSVHAPVSSGDFRGGGPAATAPVEGLIGAVRYDRAASEREPGNRASWVPPAARPTRWPARILVRLRPGEVTPAPRSLRLASVAMAGMRTVAGFLTALVVFGFRRDHAPLIWYGLVGLASVGGNFGGALLAPRLRHHFSERVLVGAAAVLILVTAIGVSVVAAFHRRPAAVVLALVIALGASLAKTAFDAIVQRDTRDRDRSRLFARFESIFQLAWVAGALVPTLIPIPLLVGYLLTAVIVASTSWVFVAGLARQNGRPGGGNRADGAGSPAALGWPATRRVPGHSPPPPGPPGAPTAAPPGLQ